MTQCTAIWSFGHWKCHSLFHTWPDEQLLFYIPHSLIRKISFFIDQQWVFFLKQHISFRTFCLLFPSWSFSEIKVEVVDTCAINNGGCDQTCTHMDSPHREQGVEQGDTSSIDNHIYQRGRPVCSCQEGYTLQQDQRSCQG